LKNDLWWLLPGKLAGMPMRFLHPERRARGGGTIDAFADDLRPLKEAGVGAVVSLLDLRGDAQIYREAGFGYFPLPIPDGGAPSFGEADEVVRFIDGQISRGHAVAVHCAAGLGRTGTILASYLIAKGMPASVAVAKVRAVEPAAIETNRQLQFLHDYASHTRSV
jgi:polymorphic toxin system DSP-PTPase phosphatase-like protein